VRDYIHVVDLAEGHVAALQRLLDRPGSFTVNLGTGRGYSVLELVRAYEAASGRAVPYEIVAAPPRRRGRLLRRPGAGRADCWAGRRGATWRACARTAGAGSLTTRFQRIRKHEDPLSPARHHGRRQSAPGCGRCRAPAIPSSSWCCRATAACSSRPPLRLQDLADAADITVARRWWWATRSTASWCWTSCASAGAEPAAVLLEPDGPQHRAGRDAGGLQAAGRRRRPGAGGHAGRPDRDRRGRLHRRAARAVPCRRRRAPSPSWASRPTAPRPATATSGPATAAAPRARGAVRREARRRHRRALPGRRRLLLERRHVRAEGLGLDGGAGSVPPDIAGRHRGRLRWAASTDARFVRPGKAEFAAVPSESVDYAVMERCPGSGIPTSAWCRWTPAGTTWAPGTPSGRWRQGCAGQCQRGRRLSGQPQHPGARHQPPGGVVGLDDVVVVETPDAVLVADRARSQDVKKQSLSPAAPASSAATSCSTGWQQRRAGRQPRRADLRRQPARTWPALQGDARHVFVQGDIGDRALVDRLLAEHQPRAIVTSPPRATSTAQHPRPRRLHPDQRRRHLHAAGSRARLLGRPAGDARRLPLPARQHRRGLRLASARTTPAFTETHPYEPNSPYSASKAASDHLVRAWHHTYGLPVLTTNCSATTTGPTTSPKS
jgi:hypothetical protein